MSQTDHHRKITAVLGPTNTGKTHHAIERMLAHRTGVIGLPLRLLAREVYDRLVSRRGPSVVALITGEERIVPERAHYWVATTEAMPTGIGADFLAVDEIQLCADAQRGHVFTDRLLHARGLKETMFMGAASIEPALRALVPEAQIIHRERFSVLSHAGSKKTSRMPPRSAIVAFSVEDVYALGELLRRQKGGAAIVMGALSPRTRNAQVAMYQGGEVDYLVATDAIGMGLNLDIDHVAFSSLTKFDGAQMRMLTAQEAGQIAGRAGRYRRDGSFGATGDARIPDAMAEAICTHRHAPLRKLHWRSSALDFGSAEKLIASLEAAPQSEWLLRARESDDLRSLKSLAYAPSLAGRLGSADDLRLMWDVCRIPDFRGISHGEHAALLEKIFTSLQQHGRIPDDWLARRITGLDRTDGGIETLTRRLAFIRTWTYVAQRKGWVDDEKHWREATRAVEDRLSDALHGALTRRFVDRRTGVLLRGLKQKEKLLAEITEEGEVRIEGHNVGRLEGFRFSQDAGATPEEARTLRAAAYAALAPQFHLRADRLYNAPDTEIDYTEQGGLMWGSEAVGKLVRGEDRLKPRVQAFVDEEAGPDVIAKVERRLQHFVDRRISTLFEPLLAMSRDEGLVGAPRGLAFRLSETFGIIPREEVAREVRELDQEARGALRRHGVRFGQYTIFLPALLKPAPTRLRLVLWALWEGLEIFPQSPPPGLVTIPAESDAPPGYYRMSGYRRAGSRAIRLDMLERLADMLRDQDSRAGFEASADMLSITGLTLEQFADLLQGLGYAAERHEREKPAPSARKDDAADSDTGSDTGSDVGAGNGGQDRAPEITGKDSPGIAADPAEGGSGAEEGESGGKGSDKSESDSISNLKNGPQHPDNANFSGSESGSDTAAAQESEEASRPREESPSREVYYIFRWRPRRAPRNREGASGAGREQAQGTRRGAKAGAGQKGGPKRPPKGARGKPKGAKRAQSYSAKPPRKKDTIDPDNPFAAALMGLRDKS